MVPRVRSSQGGSPLPSIDVEYRESRYPSGFISLRRESKRAIRFGRERTGIQRYYCKGCRRTFNDRSATPMARTKKPEE